VGGRFVKKKVFYSKVKNWFVSTPNNRPKKMGGTGGAKNKNDWKEGPCSSAGGTGYGAELVGVYEPFFSKPQNQKRKGGGGEIGKRASGRGPVFVENKVFRRPGGGPPKTGGLGGWGGGPGGRKRGAFGPGEFFHPGGWFRWAFPGLSVRALSIFFGVPPREKEPFFAPSGKIFRRGRQHFLSVGGGAKISEMST